MMLSTLIALAMAATVKGHVSAWADGMYCKSGNITGKPDLNTRQASTPLWNLTKEDWWFQHTWGCDLAPPAEGEILELPARGSFTVELAHGQQYTTLSYDGQFTSEWPGGDQHPEDWHGPGSPPDCISDDGIMHVQNQSMATGTAFAISYNSDLADVTMENLAVFTVLEHTPWKRLATYQVPDLPACPPGGCHCAWLWIPNGCGEPNMYMAGFKCNVTGATSTTPVAAAKPPVWCPEGSGTDCVKGAKQMMAWNQLTGNNVNNTVYNSPGYNADMGWQPGAQDDIFESSTSTSAAAYQPSTTSPATTAEPTPTQYVPTTFSRITTTAITTATESAASPTTNSEGTTSPSTLPYSRFEGWMDYMWSTWQAKAGSGDQSRTAFEAWAQSSWGTWLHSSST